MHLNKFTSQRNWQKLYAIVVFSGLFTLILRKISDPDIWYHLSIGREIFKTKAIPSLEFLVYPNYGDIAELHEWGYGLMMFLVHKFTGIAGLGIANALIATVTLYTLYKISLNITRNFVSSLFTLAVVLIIVDLRLAYRPEMILFITLAIQIFCLERYCDNRKNKWLIPLPLIGLFLSQFHPSVLVLLLVWGCYAFGFAWEDKKEHQRLTRTIIANMSYMTCAAVFSLFNPYGIDQLVKPIKFSSLDGSVLQYIGEFKPILETDIAFLFIGLVILCAFCLSQISRLRITYILLLLSFGFLTYRYNRNLALLGIVMFVPISIGLATLQTRLSSMQFGLKYVFSLLTFTTIAGIIYLVSGSEENGIGELSGRFPAKIATTLLEKNPTGEIFNHYDMGGYLGWKLGGKYKVFVDGRQYRKNRAWELYNAIVNIQPGWQYILKRNNVNSIVTPVTYTGSGTLIPLIDALLRSGTWVPVLQDELAFLFARRKDIDANNYIALNSDAVWKRVAADAEKVLMTRPHDIEALFTYSYSNEKLHNLQLARKGYTKIMQIQPGRQDVKQRLKKLQ